MAISNIPVTENTHSLLRSLSQQTGKPVAEILDRAVEDYRRKVFFEGVNRDYEALKANPEAWADELEERRLFENTLMDGLDSDESWPASESENL